MSKKVKEPKRVNEKEAGTQHCICRTWPNRPRRIRDPLGAKRYVNIKTNLEI